MGARLRAVTAAATRLCLKPAAWAGLAVVFAGGVHWAGFGFLWWEPTHWDWACQHWRAGTISQLFLFVFPASMLAAWLLVRLLGRHRARVAAVRRIFLKTAAWAGLAVVFAGGVHWAGFGFLWWEPTHWDWACQHWRAGTISQLFLLVFPASMLAAWLLVRLAVALGPRIRARWRGRPRRAAAPSRPDASGAPEIESPPSAITPAAESAAPVMPEAVTGNAAPAGNAPSAPPIPESAPEAAPDNAPDNAGPSRGDRSVEQLVAAYQGAAPTPSDPAPSDPDPVPPAPAESHAAKAGAALDAMVANGPDGGGGSVAGGIATIEEATRRFLALTEYMPLAVPRPEDPGRIILYGLDGTRLLAFAALPPGLDADARRDAWTRCRRARSNCLNVLTTNGFIDPNGKAGKSVSVDVFLVSLEPEEPPSADLGSNVEVLILPRPIPVPQDTLEAWEDWPDRIAEADGAPPERRLREFVEDNVVRLA